MYSTAKNTHKANTRRPFNRRALPGAKGAGYSDVWEGGEQFSQPSQVRSRRSCVSTSRFPSTYLYVVDIPLTVPNPSHLNGPS